MSKADLTVHIHNGHKRHASQLEQVDLLLVAQGDLVIRIGQADERQALCPPVQAKCTDSVGSNCQDFRAATGEFPVVVF